MKHSPHSQPLERATDSLVGTAGVAALLALIYLCTTAGPLFADNAAPSHYDLDGDGLVEVATPEQLNAIRYDLDGDGSVEDDESTEDVDEAAEYAAAFPVTSDGSVCPEGTSCTGYELTAGLDLDTDGDGTADSHDTYWNDGAGWKPIGAPGAGFAATFDGNGWTISYLFIDRSTATNVGLFGVVDEGGLISNVALVDLSVTGGGYVGGLVGRLNGATVSGSSTTGTVTGSSSRIGGLVGYGQNSIIEDSRSSASVTGTGGGRAGGLVGDLQGSGSEGGVKSAVLRSYATGRVSSDQSRVGGLVGNLHQGGTVQALVVASYATGAVSGGNIVGGLVGRSSGEVKASYATGAVSAANTIVGGLVGDNRGTVTDSYFDTDTSGQADAVQGRTTAELQAPTGYDAPPDNIFAQWIVDLDGDDVNDEPWDFGASTQYPALKVDGPDDDTAATWQEFGSQLRTRPTVTVSSTTNSVTLGWAAPAATDYPDMPSVTYQVYRDVTSIGSPQTGITYTDIGLTAGFTHTYQVYVLLNGQPTRGSNRVTAHPSIPASVTVSIADATGAEGSGLSFAASKTGTGAVTLDWIASVEDSDTAEAADLGDTTSGTVAFTEADTSKNFSVVTAQDTQDEGDETFTVTINVSSGTANLSDGIAKGTITDDDESAGAPTNLSAAAGSDKGEVDLAWTAPSDTGALNGTDPATITGYQYRKAQSSAGLESATWTDAGTATTFTVTGLAGGTTYYFQVRALNGVTPEGAASSEASATAKGRSSNAELSSLSISQGTLSPDFTAAETTYTATIANNAGSLTVTPTTTDGNATITVNGTAVTSGSVSEAIIVNVGSNTIEVVVTAEDGTKKTYTIAVTRTGPAISIADATGAEGESLSFTVSKTGTGAVTLGWTASLGDSDIAETTDLGATTSGTVSFAASDDSKTLSVATAEDAMDEDDETFTVTITVSSGTANLTDDTATGTITDDDESAGAPTDLTAATGNGDGEIDLSWTAPSHTGVLDGTDPATVTGYEYRQAESSAELTSATWTGAGTTTAFTVTGLTGGTTYQFQVRALNGVSPEGAASREASATAKGLSSNADLSALSISQGTLSPDFTAAGTAYTTAVANNVGSLTVTPTAADGNATITVNDTAVMSGSASGAVALDVGDNDVNVVVTAEDGTKKTYTITVTRTGPSVSIADATGVEGTGLSFTVSKAGTGAVTLGWTVSVKDYDTATIADLGSTTSGTLAFTESETSKSFTVATAHDAADEDNETFTVTLTATSGSPNLTDETATGTITDDDESAGAPSSLTATEGTNWGEIDLAWTEPSHTGVLNGTDPAAITGYQYRKAESSAGLTSATWTDMGTAATFTVTGLPGGTTHYFQVRALNGVNPEGAASSEANAKAKALSCTAVTSGPAVSRGTALSNHDSDGDGLIQITTVGQLNAVRYDLDGDGTVEDDDDTPDVDEADLYAAAFPVTPDGSVCPEGTECTGYELMADLDLDTDGDGTADADDAYWNDGAGWQPIGALNAGFAAILEGNGRSINNLFIDRSAATNVGLFGVVTEGSEIRNVTLAGLCVTGEQYVGGLVGRLEGATVSGVSASGAVAGSRGRIGGLVGYGQNSVIENSRSSADVTAMGTDDRRAVGGLVGELQVIGGADGVKSVVRRSYATGRVSSNLKGVGGLVGNLYWQSTPSALVVASYATGAVSGGSEVGGLVGRSNGEVGASYATGPVSGDSNVGGLVGNDQQRPATLSYFDTDTSGQTHATQGKTTVELQSPTGYEAPVGNIYAGWNVDLDGDNIDDDPWDFGTSSQYPALKVDSLDGDTAATWQEFGSQLRTRPPFTVKAGITAAALRWAAPATEDYPGAPTIAYQVYRDEAPIGPAQAGITYLDTGLAAGFRHVYRVDVLLNGEPARSSNAVEAKASATALSSNADLSALAISEGTLSPDFDGAETAYTITVANSLASLTVTATAADGNSTIAVNGAAAPTGATSGPIALKVGANIIGIIVTAEDWTEKKYIITVTRRSPVIHIVEAPDTVASVAIAAATGAEGGDMSFAVNKTGKGAVTLGWAASIGDADTASMVDLGATTSGTVAFTTLDTTKTITVTTDQDAQDENHETFTVTLKVARGTAKLTDDTATGTIIDDDESVGVPGDLIASTGTGEGEIDLSWTVPVNTGALNGINPAAVTGYQYRLAESSAGLASAAWSDSGPETKLTVAGLKVGTTYYFQVRAVNGVTPEGAASNEARAIAKALPSISIADAHGLEGSDLSFVVSKTGAGAVTLDWRTSFDESDTASTADLSGTDFGALTFTDSETSKTFIVATAQDAIEEGNEAFTVAITVAPGIAILTDETATGTITDDDQSSGAPVGLSADTGGGEGTIDLSWTAPSDTGVFNGTVPATITGYQYRHAKFSFGLASAAWTDAGQETNLAVASLEGGTLYFFQVRALNGVTPEGAPSPAVIGISRAFDGGSTAVTGQGSGDDVNVDTHADSLPLDGRSSLSTGPDEEPPPTPTPVPSSAPAVTPAPTRLATPVPIPTPDPLSTPVLMPTPAPASNATAVPHPTATETRMPSPAPTPGLKPPQGLAPATGLATTDASTAMQFPKGEGSRGMPLWVWLLMGIAVLAAAGVYAFHLNGRGNDDSLV